MLASPFFQICDSGALSCSSLFQHCQANDLPLKSFPKIRLLGTKNPHILGLIKAKDDLQGHMQLDLGIGEEGSAPNSQFLTGLLQLLE